MNESQQKEIVFLYTEDRLSVLDLSLKYNCSQDKIRAVLHKHRIKLRKGGFTGYNHKKPPSYADYLTNTWTNWLNSKPHVDTTKSYPPFALTPSENMIE